MTELRSIFETSARRYGTFEANKVIKKVPSTTTTVKRKGSRERQAQASSRQPSFHRSESISSLPFKAYATSNAGSDPPGRSSSRALSSVLDFRWSPYAQPRRISFGKGACSCRKHGCGAGEDFPSDEDGDVSGDHRWRLAYIKV